MLEPGIFQIQTNGGARQTPAPDVVSSPDIGPAPVVFEIAHFDGTPIPEPPPRPLFRLLRNWLSQAVAGNDVFSKLDIAVITHDNIQLTLRPAHGANI